MNMFSPCISCFCFTGHLCCCLSLPKIGSSLLTENNLDRNFNKLKIYFYSRTLCVWGKKNPVSRSSPHVGESGTSHQVSTPAVPGHPHSSIVSCEKPTHADSLPLNHLVHILMYSQLGEKEIAKQRQNSPPGKF